MIDIKKLEIEPYADGYEGFWFPGSTVQYPTAELEIVCWDSTLTLLLSKDQTIIEDFKEYFKDARDLDEYNLED